MAQPLYGRVAVALSASVPESSSQMLVFSASFPERTLVALKVAVRVQCLEDGML